MQWIRYGLLLQMSHVAWSVCLSVCVGHTDVLCKNGWTDRSKKVKKGKVSVEQFAETATPLRETRMPYGITQCYLPPDRGENPAFTPTEAGARFSDPGGMQGWVELCYVKADRPGLNPRPVNRKYNSNSLPLSHHATCSLTGWLL